MNFDVTALSTSTEAVIALAGTLSVKIFLLLGTILGIGVGLWFLYVAIGKLKGELSADEVSYRQGYSKEYVARFHKETKL